MYSFFYFSLKDIYFIMSICNECFSNGINKYYFITIEYMI
jgi:hypothetical protein